MRVRTLSILVGLVFSSIAACTSGGAGMIGGDADGGGGGASTGGNQTVEPSDEDGEADGGVSKTDGGTKKDAGAKKDAATTTTDPKAPSFVSLSAAGAVSDLIPTKISAVLTDPDGDDDVARGTLYDQSGAVLATFSKGSKAGAFDLELGWSTIGGAWSIEFPKGSKGSRTVEAEFFDAAGHRVAKTLSITLECWEPSKGACGGSCVDTDSSGSNCGQCGNYCPSDSSYGASGYCRSGKCAKWDGCDALTTNTSCNAICAARGKTCADACYGVGNGVITGGVAREGAACSTNVWYTNVGCSDVMYSDVLESVACCCL